MSTTKSVATVRSEAKRNGKAKRHSKTKRGGNARRQAKSQPFSIGPSIRASDLAPETWTLWVDYLAERRHPVELHRAFDCGKHTPLGWALASSPESITVPAMLKLVERVQRGKVAARAELAEEAAPWLEAAGRRTPDCDFAVECLAWCHVLVPLAESLGLEVWRDLLEQLTGIARDAASLPLQESPLPHQLLAGELPLTLAYLLPEIDTCRDLLAPARSALSFGVQELLDGEGLPHCRFLDALRPLLACWTRATLMARHMDTECLDPESREQFRWIVQQALRLTRTDGTHVFTNGTGQSWPRSLVRIATNLADDPVCSSIWAHLNSDGSTIASGRKGDRRIAASTPEPSVYSDWAETAIMRAGWSAKDPQLAVTFGERRLRTELNSGGLTLWSGLWDCQITLDGHPHAIESDWSELCWVSDDDVDYLELEAEFGSGWKVQRQLLLARQDHFVYLADVVFGPEPRVIELRSTLPLVEGVEFEPARETREGSLTQGKPRGLVLPLALPEWRAERADGALEAAAGGLEWTHRRHTQRMYVPRLIDLDSGRLKKEATWRQLTVAEQLEIVPRDVAVGYRVQIGKRQWLFYRSLAPRGNRTVLGQNFATEFVCGRFTGAGTVETLIEIE